MNGSRSGLISLCEIVVRITWSSRTNWLLTCLISSKNLSLKWKEGSNITTLEHVSENDHIMLRLPMQTVAHSIIPALSEITFLASYKAGSYGTQCSPEMFSPINRSWTTTPFTEVPGLFLAGSDAFLPSVTGAMYGGCIGACAVLGKLGSLRLGSAILFHLASNLRQENPKLTKVESYILAVKKFLE